MTPKHNPSSSKKPCDEGHLQVRDGVCLACGATASPIPLTTEQRLAAIREACLKANPDLVIRVKGKQATVTDSGVLGADLLYEPGLADVLLALEKLQGDSIGVDAEGFFIRREWTSEGIGLSSTWNDEGSHRLYRWDLRRDSLDDQEEATIVFLHSLLCS